MAGEARDGPRSIEIQRGIRTLADLTGAGNVTPEAIVTRTDPDTGAPREVVKGNPSPYEIAPTTTDTGGKGGKRAVTFLGRAIAIEPGTKIIQPGTLAKPAVVDGASTVFQQAGGPKDPYPLAQAPANHILRIVEKRLAFLADDPAEEEAGGGGCLAWIAGRGLGTDESEGDGNGGDVVTRIADFWAPGRGPSKSSANGLTTMTRAEAAAADAADAAAVARQRTMMRADALVALPADPRAGLPLALDAPPEAIEGRAASGGAIGQGVPSPTALSASLQGNFGEPERAATRGRKYLGWFTSEDGVLWRPAVEIEETVPEKDPPSGGGGRNGPGGGPGPQGPQGPQGPAGPGGGKKQGPPPTPPPVDGPIGSSDPRDPNDGEVTACDQEEPPTEPPGGGGGVIDRPPGNGGPVYVPPEKIDAWKKWKEAEKARRKRNGDREKQGLPPLKGDELPVPDAPIPGLSAAPGTVAARSSAGAGTSILAPKALPLDNDGDVRQRLGGGPYMRTAPLVPGGGIRVFDAFDFSPSHRVWDVIGAMLDKTNQVISFVNARLPGAPNVISSGGLYLPAQDASKVRLEQFDLGSVISVARTFKGSREAFRLLHHVTADKSGRRLLDRISSDRAPERTIGTGEKGVDILTRFATGERAHRDKGKVYDLQPKIGWDATNKRLVATGADLVVDALVVGAEDGSETKVETTAATGATTFKRTPVGGAEVTTTMDARDGKVVLAPAALTSGQLVQADANGDLVPAGSGGSVSYAGIKFSNGTINRTLNTDSYTIDSLADNLYTLCFDLATYGYANGWTLSGETDNTLDCSAFTADQLAMAVQYLAADVAVGGTFIPSDYTVMNRQHVFYLDCDSYTMNQLGYALAALLNFMGA